MHLQSKWEEKAARGEPVLVYEHISKLTLDIILRCAFSYKSQCQMDGLVHMITLSTVIYVINCILRVTNEYMQAVAEACKLISKRNL